MPEQIELKPWLIWSNEHLIWWRKNRAGYTSDQSQAGRYTWVEAQDICAVPCYRTGSIDPQTRMPTEIAVPAPEAMPTILAALDSRPLPGTSGVAGEVRELAALLAAAESAPDLQLKSHLTEVARQTAGRFLFQNINAIIAAAENAEIVAKLRTLVAEALEPGVFGYQDRSGISGPEDPYVISLCEQFGYGAVMDAASRMWREKLSESEHGDLSGGEHTVAACASVRKDWCERAALTLAPAGEKETSKEEGAK